MAEEKVKFGSGLLGNKLTIYDNRVEVVAGCFPFDGNGLSRCGLFQMLKSRRFLTW